jgi:hypothetical protein
MKLPTDLYRQPDEAAHGRAVSDARWLGSTWIRRLARVTVREQSRSWCQMRDDDPAAFGSNGLRGLV